MATDRTRTMTDGIATKPKPPQKDERRTKLISSSSLFILSSHRNHQRQHEICKIGLSSNFLASDSPRLLNLITHQQI